MSSEREAKVAEEIQRITSQLEAVASRDISNVPERVFREVFLPMFAGKEDLVYPATTQIWANIAGSYYAPVNIVNEKNEILYTVPPLMNNKAVNPVSSDEIPIAHVVATAKQYANMHPAQGAAYLDAELTKRSLLMRLPSNVLEDIATWNKIFERYGYPVIMETETLIQKNGNEASPAGDGDFEFEPL